MVKTLLEGSRDMNEIPGKPVRRVKVSKQRQISIPKDFFAALDFNDEAFIEFTGTELIIRPAGLEEVDFSEDILRDLVTQGYSGEELIDQFKKYKSNIPWALEAMKTEAMKQPAISGNLDLDAYLDSLEDEEEDE